MKKLIFGFLLAVTSLSASAFDSWTDKVYPSGEVLYKSGFEQYLLIGKKGLGFSYAIIGAADNFGDEIRIKFDAEESKKIKVKKIGTNTFLISDAAGLIKKAAQAKRVEIDYRICFTNQLCGFSETGGEQNAVWRFEVPLAEQFKDYQDKIR